MEVPIDSITEFAQELIRIPSQGGIDSCEPIFGAISRWLDDHGTSCQILHRPTGESIAAVIEMRGAKNGRKICLNACVDTAPFGDLEAWDFPPTSGTIAENWLCGRGSADSKIAIAIFSHLAIGFRKRANEFSGTLSFLFDGDEHTGQFGGIKEYIRQYSKPEAIAIGYPGNDFIMIGARGFYRIELTTYGTAAHSGLSKNKGQNAIIKAAALIERLARISLPQESDLDFSFGPRLTITTINGGSGYSVVPDKCCVSVDIRLTPAFDKKCASRLIKNIIAEVDSEYPSRHITTIREEESWPPYKLSPNSALVRALSNAANEQFGRRISTAVSGPSNIGNYLASLGIEATCGFGVTYRNLHGTNERIDLSTIGPVYKTYWQTIETLLLK